MEGLYDPYPKLPKNIRQIGERDDIVRVYVEDYVNTYLKRLFPAGGQDLRAGILLGSTEEHGSLTYVFIDGALEMEGVTEEGEKVVFSEEAWKKAYQQMEDMFPKRTVQGWFLCGVPGCLLSPLDYWKQHSQYFSGKNKLMYLNSGLEGEEALYITSSDGFYKLRGHCIYYERNQMMQDYMVSRKDVQRVEAGGSDPVIRDFRKKMEKKKEIADSQDHTIHFLRGMCACLAILALAGGVAAVNSAEKMKDMETVMASALPVVSDAGKGYLARAGFDLSGPGDAGAASGPSLSDDAARPGGTASAHDPSQVILEEAPGGIFPTVPAGQDSLTTGGEGPLFWLDESTAAEGDGGAASDDGEGAVAPGEGAPAPGGEGASASGGEGAPASGGEGAAAGTELPVTASGEGVSAEAGGTDSKEGTANGQTGGHSGQAQSGGTESAVTVNAAGEQVKGQEASADVQGEGGQDKAPQPEDSQKADGGDSPQATEAFAARQLEPAPGQGVYIVQPGETLYGICFKLYQNLSKVEEICQINGLEDIDMLEAGRRLIVP